MSDEALKQKIHDVLKTSYFNGPDDLVDVSDGFEDNLHVVIVEPKVRRQTAEGEEQLGLVAADEIPRPRGVGKGFLVDQRKPG